MCYSQYRMNQLLGEGNDSIFSFDKQQNDFWNRKPDDDFNEKMPGEGK